jgi:hypothetical protein
MDKDIRRDTRKEMITMSDEQHIPNTHSESRRNTHAARQQERHVRRLEKQAAHDAQCEARSRRPRRDWSFEVNTGEKKISFTWRWHGQAEAQVEENSPQQFEGAQETGSTPAE